VVLIDHASVSTRQQGGMRYDGCQDLLQVKAGTDGPTNLAQRLELLDRAGQFGRAFLQVPEELRARQGDRRGAGEGLQQLDLLIAEWTDLETQQAEHAEWGALVEQRDRQVGSIPPPPLEVARERILGQNRG